MRKSTNRSPPTAVPRTCPSIVTSGFRRSPTGSDNAGRPLWRHSQAEDAGSIPDVRSNLEVLIRHQITARAQSGLTRHRPPRALHRPQARRHHSASTAQHGPKAARVPKRRRVRRAVRHQSTCRPAAAGRSGIGSTAAATEPSTARSTPSPSPACDAARPPRTTSPDAQPKARPAVRSGDASSATSPASSTAPSTPAPPSPPKHRQLRRPLDKRRSVRCSSTVW